MEKESFAQSTAWDRPSSSVLIYGIAVYSEKRCNIVSAHYFCVRIAVVRVPIALSGARKPQRIVICQGALLRRRIRWTRERVALELVPNDQPNKRLKVS